MMRTQPTPQELVRDEIRDLNKELLGKKFYSLRLISLRNTEDFESCEVKTELSMLGSHSKKPIECSGTGVGVVHSMFLCLKEVYAKKYVSLKNINLHSFDVKTRFDTAKSFEKTDAQVDVIIEFKNASGILTPFRASSTSLLRSLAIALIDATQFYINSELSFLKLRTLIKDAERRNRPDIKGNLISKITKIIGVSSYEESVSGK